ncbi:arginyl-tRNA synthetase [Spiroplasma tabanidicola]|uniref:Arginine--tRNA ligase n=1 Tax=Spiroplasma tabanidicola TaxID=324079 RepID=A0A6I6CCG4_9MOLU|nr:arginine--tRNA ligase [Spiroplasma tabanidicola]QGS51664.1 arginyl-tRNA synthetase [Spiroplasma tabanidicola]
MSLFVQKITNILNKIIIENNLKGEIIIESSKDENKGDFSTNFALINSKLNEKKPRELAGVLIASLSRESLFDKVEIAGPGFINMTINKESLGEVILKVLKEKDQYGKSRVKNLKYNLELVSANPTGYLHIGHARNGAIGDSVARILKFAGYEIETEYYTNDAGNQINISASTLFYHYKNLLNEPVNQPTEMYGGDMYIEVAKLFLEKFGDKFKNANINEDNKIDDPEIHNIFRSESISFFMKIIKQQLKDFGVEVDLYTSEAKMYETHEIEKTLDLYEKLGKTYTNDNALWLKTTEFGDDKDRVLKKSNGDYTYITPDLASHNSRFKRSKADLYVNFWGGDHHGYINRMNAGLALLGYPLGILKIDMIQMVRLIKDGTELKMSKRKGTAIWLIDLLEMVGKDSIRYMLVSKNPSSHMDFDLDVVLKKNSTNPVYYAQYATARAYKIIQKANDLNWDLNNSNFNLLSTQKEKEIILLLDAFNKTVEYSANNRLPSVICDYIQNLAKRFHSYYSDFKVIDEENVDLSTQRCQLVKAIYQVLSNCFDLIGIDVINSM